VPREVIDEILEAARWAPSAGNCQPWEFLVVDDRETIQRLAELYEYQMIEKKWLEGTRPRDIQMYMGDSFPSLDEDQIRDALKEVRGKAPIRSAPCIIFPLGDERWHQAFPLRTRLERGHQHIISSLACVVLVLHLAAASLDLATQWLSDFESPWLSGMTKHLLGIPQNYMIYEAMPVGFPTYYPKPRYVKPLQELVHYGRYDPARGRTEEEIREYVVSKIRPQLKFRI
jgi:nitroreductase